MLKELSNFTNVYKEFLKFIYATVFKGNIKAFKEHHKSLNDNTTILRAIEFLEQENVPVLDALIYYSYMYPSATFKDKLKNLVIKEFYRIENNIKCDYIPF